MPNLQRLVNKWVDRFRLHDWDITVSLVPFTTLNPTESDTVVYGTSVWDHNERTAIVQIVDRKTVPAQWRDGVRLEELVVHELLHILVAGHEPATDNVNEERVVRVLTSCLCPPPRRRREAG